MSGERRAIGLITSDMRFANKVREAASSHGIRIIHVLGADDLPLSVRVVITDEGGVKLGGRIILHKDDYDSVEELIERAVEAVMGKLRYRLAAVAVDPGKNIGAAYILDYKIVKTRRYGMVEKLLDDLSRFMKIHRDAGKKYILIGATSSPSYAEEIAEKIRRALYGEDVAIKLVDESNTSRSLIPRMKNMSKDEYSALILSLRNLLRLR